MTLPRNSAAASSEHPSIVKPPTVTWPDTIGPTPGHLRNLRCPNCDSANDKSLVLGIVVQLPDNPPKELTLVRCPDCTCCFYDSQVPPDYAEPGLNNRGRVPFYVQQGAGVSLITKPLAQVQKPVGSSYMEVGCGFGFGLDFALRTRGWQGIGIDPAPLAELGRDALNLPIELRYLRDDDEARGTMDVVMGSEVIEHVTSPRAFLRTVCAMLKPDGVLILTTPNAEDILPATPPGILVPLLSPSLHLVIQNPTSMRRLLTEVGFTHVKVEIDSHSLVAFASKTPLAIETDHNRLRQVYRRYLLDRSRDVAPDSDIFIGFAGRAFFECVNDADFGGAQEAWDRLLPVCRVRYGFDLNDMVALPAATVTCGLEEMARLMPINLSLLLYGSAIRQLNSGVPRRQLEQRFALAAAAANVLRRALGELAMEDGLTEDIGWTSSAEVLLCAADAGDRNIVARIRELPPSPSVGEGRRRAIIERALTGLVNAGHYALGRALAAAEGLWIDPDVRIPESDSSHDLMFALGILELQKGGNPGRGRKYFHAVHKAVATRHHLFWPAVRGELQTLVNLGRRQEASTLVTDIVRTSDVAESEIPEDIRKQSEAGRSGR